ERRHGPQGPAPHPEERPLSRIRRPDYGRRQVHIPVSLEINSVDVRIVRTDDETLGQRAFDSETRLIRSRIMVVVRHENRIRAGDGRDRWICSKQGGELLDLVNRYYRNLVQWKRIQVDADQLELLVDGLVWIRRGDREGQRYRKIAGYRPEVVERTGHEQQRRSRIVDPREPSNNHLAIRERIPSHPNSRSKLLQVVLDLSRIGFVSQRILAI